MHDLERLRWIMGNVETRRPTWHPAEEHRQDMKDEWPTVVAAKQWMRHNIEDYVDVRTGEINTTRLAEDCVHESGIWPNDSILDDADHWIWDAALDVGRVWQDLKEIFDA